MKALIFVLYLFQSTSFQGTGVIDSDNLRVNGLIYRASKEDIIKEFGKPIETFNPDYECGFLSNEMQGAEYYSMKYDFFVFTGNDTEGYLLEEVLMVSTLNARISYNGKTLSHSTTIQEFEEIFETTVESDSLLLFFKGADDALNFTFKNGKLTKIRYWSPC